MLDWYKIILRLKERYEQIFNVFYYLRHVREIIVKSRDLYKNFTLGKFRFLLAK